MKYIDERTGFLVCDSALDPLKDICCQADAVRSALGRYILSASGWRNVFAASKDEEDAGEVISDEDAVIVAHIAHVFYEGIGKNRPRVLLAVDARPTGRILSYITMRVLVGLGADVSYLFISAAPETMAYSHEGFDAFCYISASHNPIGHNGFKFGVDGGVYERTVSDALAVSLRAALDGDDCVERAKALSAQAQEEQIDKVLLEAKEEKAKALAYYRTFVLETAGVDSSFHADCGIVGELNGSARSLSIDEGFLQSLGCKTHYVNDRAGAVVHAIVPEGENLIPCRDELKKCHEKDKRFILGYCPDNDGDRGNFVYVRQSTGECEILQAQEVFALVVAIELADLSKKGVGPLAVAVNCPTSERIEALGEIFGAKVFRAEVGEANVVNLAAELRSQGYVVHVLGEGSNGGNITDPAKVRDPLNSVMTFLKLFADKSLFSYAIEKMTGKKPEGEPSLEAMVDALPVYTTTGAFSSLAKLHVKHTDWARLKKEYERLFVTQWQTMALEEEGIMGYEERQTEGTKEVVGMGEAYRSPAAKGGLKMVLIGEGGEHLAYLWLRPSGTEPVLRVLVDVKGKKEALHDRLLSWQRSLIDQADKALD